MTSKEIFAKNVERCLPCVFCFKAKEEIQIMNDLKAAEILKKYFKYDEETGLYMIAKCFYDATINYGYDWEEQKKEYEMIKRWIDGN